MKGLKCHVISKHRPFLAFKWFTIFKAAEQIRPVLFSIDDWRAFVIFQLSASSTQLMQHLLWKRYFAFKCFSSFPGVLRKPFIFSIQCNKTNLTKRSHFFHPSLNIRKLSFFFFFFFLFLFYFLDVNFLELRSTKLSAFKLNSFAFHFTFSSIYFLDTALASTCITKQCVYVTFSICYVIKVHVLSLCQTNPVRIYQSSLAND